ncbi:MAG: DUF21 domain-containing protein [Candidatus Omnitrophica bacterium]|nr:DUF21 domain-containing protein [Candidatus Omnitrophota bacterium]
MPFAFELTVIILMIAVNAVFAAYEMSLASISNAKLTALVNLKLKGAAEAAYMKGRMEASLAVVQVGITLVGAIAAAVGGAGMERHFAPAIAGALGISRGGADILALIFLILPLSAMTIVFAELIPKTYAIHHQAFVCLALSPLMKVLAGIAYPVVAIFEGIVKRIIDLINRTYQRKNRPEENTGLHELNAAVALARTSRLLGAREEGIVLAAAQLSVRPIKESMIPINDVSTIPLETSLTQALVHAHNDMHTRFPVCAVENDLQTIQGYVNFKDIMAGLKLNPSDPSIKGIIRPIKTFESHTPISQALERMMQEKLHIALVSSKEGRTIGMVTLEDIIEEMVGEIEDEFDRLPSYIHPYGGGWIVGGGVTMAVLGQTVGEGSLPLTAQERSLKLADWFAQKTGRPLLGGESVHAGRVLMMVRKLRRKKLGEAIITLNT